METLRESSSDDSVEGEVESENDDVTIVDEEHETSQTTSTLSSAANDSSGNLSRKKRRPRSVVWKFFSALQGRKSVQCQLCPAGNRDGVLAYHGGTSSMHEHLKKRHYTAFCEATTNDSSDTSASKQTRLDSFTRSVVYPRTRSKAITDRVAGVIIKDLRPISLVDGEGFQSLMSFVEPGYHLPSATYFTKVIELKCQEAVTKVQQTLQAANYISITSDMWTSLANDAYISLTTHYISNEWKMESVCLGTIPVSERHTGDNIALWIEEILVKFGIGTQKVVSFVHDNGSNFVRAGKILTEKFEWSSESCAGHDLQLCIKAGLEVDELHQVVSAARRLVEYFKKSELATTALQKRQQQMSSDKDGNSTLQIVQDVKTRWNSVYYMIDRLLKLRLPISAVIADSAVTRRDHRNLDLQPSSWDLLEQLKAVLYPFQVATTYLSSEYNVSVSAMLPVVHGIVKNMQPDSGDLSPIQAFKNIVTRELTQRWHLNEIDPTNPSVPLLATFLDPRFKDTKFLNRSQKSSLETSVIYLINCCISVNSTTSNTSQASSQSHQLSALDILLGEDNSTERNRSDNHVHVTEIVRAYLSDKVPSRESSPLQWWKINSLRYSVLVPLVQKYFCVPATSTPSERIFSCAGVIANRLRSSLNPEHLNMLVFLNKNYKVL